MTCLPVSTAFVVAGDYALTSRVAAELVGGAAGLVALFERTSACVVKTALAIEATNPIAVDELAATGGPVEADLPHITAGAIALDVDALTVIAAVAALVGPAGSAVEDVATAIGRRAACGRHVTALKRRAAAIVVANLAIGTAGVAAIAERTVTREGAVTAPVVPTTTAGEHCATGFGGRPARGADLVARLNCATRIPGAADLARAATGVAALDSTLTSPTTAGLILTAARPLALDVVTLALERVIAEALQGVTIATLEDVTAAVAGEATGARF